MREVDRHMKKSMGSNVSKTQHQKELDKESKILADLLSTAGNAFPGSDYHPSDRKNWMSELDPGKVRLNQIVWPGTHDSATKGIGIPFFTRPFAECQDLSIYQQLVTGVRVLDIRVGKNQYVYHGILRHYSVDVVIDGVKRFLTETRGEVVVLEVRTEYGHRDPPEFEKYLVEKLGEDVLIHQDDRVFGKTLAEVLPRRVICIWKPRDSPATMARGPIWSESYLKDDWIDTDKPWTKFENNMRCLGDQPPSSKRKYFYRVENTVTPQTNNPIVRDATERIRVYVRLFISQAFAKGLSDRLQVISTDFVDYDFVDVCVGLTRARVEGVA